ncbi:MDR/zinc-dependent alcohol dehydrogenase-like family protein [Saccharopolyspora rosea]|uniref:hypothetical protein n=1 Tax=Saccharopolyspora rosea TaxID=524884 RepID=UPI0021D98F1D|nr:hypothetical protein [Saccharopolyspora rosea]
MRALAVDPEAPAQLRLTEVAEPAPRPGQVLLDVRHISLNHGEIAFAGRLAPGTGHGYAAAGVVAKATDCCVAAGRLSPEIGGAVRGNASTKLPKPCRSGESRAKPCWM